MIVKPSVNFLAHAIVWMLVLFISHTAALPAPSAVPAQERRSRDSDRIKRVQQRPVTLPQSVSSPSLSVLEAIISLEQDTISTHPLPDPRRQYSQGLEETNNDDWCDRASSSPGISPPSCSFVHWWWDLRKRDSIILLTTDSPSPFWIYSYRGVNYTLALTHTRACTRHLISD